MNGIIVIDKPKGRTSHDMVYFIRRMTGIKKVGHTGTLDPDATGVLPLCIGNGTKVSDMLLESDKCYRAELILGKTTDTQDLSGNVLEEKEVTSSEEEIVKAAESFVGEIEQIPPMYSAIKQDGKKLYELARKGIEVERKPRRVTINEITIVKIDKNTVTIDVDCSKGTYIRTLCSDIGEKLGCGGCMGNLRRTKAGMFNIDESHTVEEIEKLKENGKLGDIILPVDSVFMKYPKIQLNEKQVKSVTNGIRMTYKGVEGQTYRVYDNNNEFLCISKIEDGKLRLVKSFWN